MERPWARAGSAALAAATWLLVVVPTTQADLLVSNSNSILRFDGTTGAFLGDFVPPGGGGLTFAEGLTYGPDGNLYVSNGFTKNVKKYDGRTGAFLGDFVTDSGGSLLHIGFGPDGHLYTYEVLGVGISRYDGKTGAPLGSFTSGALVIGSGGFAFGPDGNLYASTVQSPGVDVFNGTTGVFLRELMTTGASPGGVTFGPDGNLYVTAGGLGGPGQVLRYDAMAGTFATFASGGGLTTPGYVAFGPDGNLYVASAGTDNILRYDGRTGAFLDVFASGHGLSFPLYFTFSPTAAPVPEPGSLALLALGIVSLVARGRKLRGQPR